MNRKDLHSGVSMAVLVGVAVLSATPTVAGVDLRGYSSAEIVISTGIGGITFTGTNRVDYIISHSDDNSNFVAVADSDLRGITGTSSGIVKSLIAAHAAADVARFGYVGGKRYVKCVPTFGGTHATGTPIGVNIILGNAQLGPTADQP